MKKGTVVQSGNDYDEDIRLINNYSRKELTPNEVYTFTVVLCDNDIDRDFERFTVESLFSLQELFLGKTGICDHNPKAENQRSRIYKTWVEAVEGKTTKTGDEYFKLMAKAYIPISECSADFIEKIDTGILKEVSVGCGVRRTVCSVCGNDINSVMCTHRKGEVYGKNLCYGELLNPTDAYEWSFVAVPAQTQAGVVKSFYKGEKSMEKIISCLKSDKDVTLDLNERKKLLDYIGTLEKDAADGRSYRESLMSEVKKYALLSKCGITSATLDNIVKSLSARELCELRDVYEKAASSVVPVKPQTYSQQKNSCNDNDKFTI